jgi:hypothetical protein
MKVGGKVGQSHPIPPPSISSSFLFPAFAHCISLSWSPHPKSLTWSNHMLRRASTGILFHLWLIQLIRQEALTWTHLRILLNSAFKSGTINEWDLAHKLILCPRTYLPPFILWIGKLRLGARITTEGCMVIKRQNQVLKPNSLLPSPGLFLLPHTLPILSWPVSSIANHDTWSSSNPREKGSKMPITHSRQTGCAYKLQWNTYRNHL